MTKKLSERPTLDPHHRLQKKIESMNREYYQMAEMAIHRGECPDGMPTPYSCKEPCSLCWERFLKGVWKL